MSDIQIRKTENGWVIWFGHSFGSGGPETMYSAESIDSLLKIVGELAIKRSVAGKK